MDVTRFQPRHGQILIHSRRPGWLVKVRSVGQTHAYITRIDVAGYHVRRARRFNPIPLDRLTAAYQLYRPCRWSLLCLAQATTTVQHIELGEYDVCEEHAAEHRDWVASGSDLYNEPNPECWCTDSHLSNGETVPYCPTHGTPAQRGSEMEFDEVNL